MLQHKQRPVLYTGYSKSHMANTAICNARHVINNLQPWFLLFFPTKEEGYSHYNHNLLIHHSFNLQIPQQQQ